MSTTTFAPPGQLIMQYAIALPADYDMAVIRERVRTRGHALDHRAGLGFKAYCVRERGVDGALVNQYAPFYLWDDAPAAGDFLWNRAGFQAIVDDFGRPSVRTWVPVGRRLGQAPAAAVRFGRIRTTPLGADADLTKVAADLRSHVETAAEKSEHTHLSVAGIDPTSWCTVEFVAGAEMDDTDPDWLTYSVLHLSEPTSTSVPPT
ncbi:DUF4865 family protein [Antrihabitans stalagmiti]|nr:DUF4865 family protein [Antrihabitans stalagmiti]